MTASRLFVGEIARRDIVLARDFYRQEAGAATALRFLEAVETAFSAMADFPGAGSARYAHVLGLAELRFVRIPGYPYLAFYLERDGAVDVWRVLHAQRDIPGWLADS